MSSVAKARAFSGSETGASLCARLISHSSPSSIIADCSWLMSSSFSQLIVIFSLLVIAMAASLFVGINSGFQIKARLECIHMFCFFGVIVQEKISV